MLQETKEEIWLSPMTKAHTVPEMSKEQSDNTNNATKKFDYTAVADRLRTVSWSNYGHPTGVVNLGLRAKPSHFPQQPCNQKETRLNFVNKPPYIHNKPIATPSGEVIKIDTRKA